MTDAAALVAEDTDVSEYAGLVAALYAKLHTWQKVADACNNGRDYKPAYYWRIARGKIKTPGARGRRGIRAAVESELPSILTGLNAPTEREARYGLAVRRSRGLATNQWRKERGLTWDQWFQEADELMREKYNEEASE